MVLPVLVRRLHFEARDDIRFPGGKAANVLRGGFGIALRNTVPEPEYARIFEPKSVAPGPSGLADPPRPFVFRAAHLDGSTISKRDDFHFDIHVFGEQNGTAEVITSALAHLLQAGVGVGRGTAKLLETLDRRVEIALLPAEPAARVKVQFLTPTQLKHQGAVVFRPDFPILIRRIRDRVATLMSLYGPGELPLDFQLFGQRADSVEMVRSDIDQMHVARTSTRTNQSHSIGGLVGEAEYRGAIGPYVPFLRAAFYTGVGRHTVWGNGCLQTTILERGLE